MLVLNHWEFQKLSILLWFPKISPSIINLLNEIQMEFIWKENNEKIWHSILCNKFWKIFVKSVDIFSKVVSLQCYWIKRLSDNNFHQCNVTPLCLARRYLGQNFVSFYSRNSQLCFMQLSRPLSRFNF